MVAVMGDEILQQTVDFRGGQGAALRGQTALDHHPRAAADHVAGGLVGDRRQAFPGQDGVEGSDQIGRGVDEGAVEVEDDGRVERHLDAVASRLAKASHRRPLAMI